MPVTKLLPLPRLAALILLLFARPLLAGQTQVAVAANFSQTMQRIVEDFQQQSGHRVGLSFGSSGKFYAQIRQGAPFEVLLSADSEKPAALEKAGLTVNGQRFTYAMGTLALWSALDNISVQGADILSGGDFNRLALANPRLAPYGLAAMQVLDTLKLTQLTRHKWVLGENIGQTYQFVATGNAELGFVALSQLLARNIPSDQYWQIPATLHQPIRQDAVLLSTGRNNPAAIQLLAFLQGEKARRTIREHGYTLPPEKPAVQP